mgnify:FL=1
MGGRNKSIKARYYKLGHKRCHYCCIQLNYAAGHKNSATVEHIIPKSSGGTLSKENTLVVCHTCNQKRGSKDFLSFTMGSRFPRSLWLKAKLRDAQQSMSMGCINP